MAVLYFYLDANFESCTSIQSKIAKIDALIDQLFIASTKIANTSNHASYKIDDGQTVQEIVYTSAAAIMKSIKAYENMRQFYVNKIIGNAYRNIGSKNLNRGRFC